MNQQIALAAITGITATIVPTVGILLVWLQNKTRFDAIDKRFDAVNQRFDDMKDLWRSELRRVEEVLDARLKHQEEKR